MIAVAAVLGTSVFAAESTKTDGPPPDFVVGDYVLIGREPDGGATYSGSARIAPAGDSLVLEHRRGDRHHPEKGRSCGFAGRIPSRRR